jgi:outer membrane protein OmpA-like peptidoglycan-associated protein
MRHAQASYQQAGVVLSKGVVQMAKCRPAKWIFPWAILGAALPLLVAHLTNTTPLLDDIKSRAGQALSSNEQTAWGTVELDGRDATLRGTAPSQEAVDLAVKAVAGTYGIRTVANAAQIVAPVTLTAPTVESVTATTPTPEIKGTWQEGVATSLAVKVGPDVYKLGENPELSSMGGNWLLKLSKPMVAGTYDVTVETSDGKESTVAEAGKLVIDLPEAVPLPLPTVENFLGNTDKPTLKGTWPEEAAKAAGRNLQVKLGEQTFVLGTNPELTSDGSGNWQLTPSTALPEGTVEVMPGLVAADGNWIKAAAPAKAVVDLTPPPMVELTVPAPDVKWPYVISGKWPEVEGNTLSATLAGKTYQLGSAPELTSDGAGNFSFDPKVELKPGSYDIDFTVNDPAGNATKQTLAAAIVIPEPAAPVAEPEPAPAAVPATPAVVAAPAANAVWPYAITGTWDERPGNTLSASMAGRSYVLGRGSALSSDGKGNFTFAPAARLAPGAYDVDFTTTDSAGKALTTTAKSAIVVPEPPAPAETPVAQPEPAPKPVQLPELPAPTVTAQLDLTGAPIIRGTWPSDLATGLTVAVAGRTYTKGVDANLATKGNDWTLLPGAGLADGTYDVVAEVSDAAGNTKRDATSNELEVDGVQPAAPTVMTSAGDVSPDHLSGTWDEAGAVKLRVSVPQAGIVADLGAGGSPLTSDGKGNWRLNLAAPLAPGKYNVIVESTDSRGRVQTDTSDVEVVVVAKGNPVPPPPPPYDCVAVMNRIGNVFPIRFEYDLTDITKPFDLSVSQYASLLMDKRCTSINVDIKGHADFRGSEEYNMGLSERRAEVIRDMLLKAGVDEKRMSLVALGESDPLDPALTDEARAKNRRVQITVKP